MVRRPAASRPAKPDVVIGTCAHCGKPGEIGPEITVLASRDEVHHECWAAFFAAKIRRDGNG